MKPAAKEVPCLAGPGEQPLLSELWLTDMGLSGAPTIRFSLCGSKLDVNHTAVGVGKALYLQGPITEIALYASTAPSSHQQWTFRQSRSTPDHLDLCMLFCFTGPDLGKRFWKLVGVYPVSDGFARLDLKELEGKGQTGDEALYIVPGGN